jgi:NADPH:quinone reductase-like Zn-dependent oxidoreductase
MRALRFGRQGSLDHLELLDLPAPGPAAGEALVEVRAAGLNPSDTKNVLGKMAQTILPRIPGRDFAGVVTRGSAAWLGAEVMGSGDGLGFTRDGSHAELLAVPEEALVRKPPEISFEQAAALGVPYLAAWMALIDGAGLRRGETALVLGVNGAVGGAAGRLAHWRGARVLGTVRASTDRTPIPETPSPAADEIIDLDSRDLVAAVMETTGGRGVDVALDVVGGPMFEPCLRCLAHGGRQVSIAASGDPRVSFNLADFYHREARLLGIDTLALDFAGSRRILELLVPGLRDGSIAPPAFRTWPLANAPAAYRLLESGKADAKIVLVP